MSQITLTVPGAVNWKTTLFGALAALGAYFLTLQSPTFQLAGQVLTVGGPLLMGVFAKDASVTGNGANATTAVTDNSPKSQAVAP